uniref:Salivary lipocalin n=1 Tax=Ixodes ricinus TaxID=34613 RepID=V5GMJ2_IXORI
MYPTLLVFASLVAAITSVDSQETSSVDAWKTVSLPGAFYLKYRSYEKDDSLGGTGKCVSIQLSKADQDTKTAVSKMRYRDPQTNQMTEKTVCAKVATPLSDTIQMGDGENCEGATTRVRFVYSDYENCDVTVVLGTDGSSPKCELWVKEGYQQLPEANADAVASRDDASVKTNLAKCKEEYDNQCKDQTKYRIYDTDTCGSLAKPSK